MSTARSRGRREARAVEIEAAQCLAQFAALKDNPNSGHIERVGLLSALIAQALGMSDEDVETIRYAAQLHDVGKVGIPDAILFNDNPLTLEQLDVVKTHTVIGATILSNTQMQLFRVAEAIALHHHENWNGTGYTPGLAGDAIPLVARIVRVSDAYDAMTMSRPYAEPWRREAAVEFIQNQSGLTFDPLVVNAFSSVVHSALDAVIV